MHSFGCSENRVSKVFFCFNADICFSIRFRAEVFHYVVLSSSALNKRIDADKGKVIRMYSK